MSVVHLDEMMVGHLRRKVIEALVPLPLDAEARPGWVFAHPYVDGRWHGGLHSPILKSWHPVVLEGIARGFCAVNIRKFVVRATRLADLVALDSLSEQAARFLEASVTAGLNILVSGATQAGKTTALNCLAAAIPGRERVVSVEEVFELRFGHPDWVALQTRQRGLEGTGEIRLRDLVKESLRMRPSRIIVGEVRAEECLDLLLALNAGLPGMASLHANSAREALVKMCTLPLLAGENISPKFVVRSLRHHPKRARPSPLGALGRRYLVHEPRCVRTTLCRHAVPELNSGRRSCLTRVLEGIGPDEVRQCRSEGPTFPHVVGEGRLSDDVDLERPLNALAFNSRRAVNQRRRCTVGPSVVASTRQSGQLTRTTGKCKPKSSHPVRLLAPSTWEVGRIRLQSF